MKNTAHRAPYRGYAMATKARVMHSGRLLEVLRSGGEWLAVVQALGTSRASDPIITTIQSLDTLKGQQGRKADRCLAELA